MKKIFSKIKFNISFLLRYKTKMTYAKKKNSNIKYIARNNK